MAYKCLIVDDEPPAQRIIERFLNDLPSVEIVGKCNNAFEASQVIMNQQVDILFLDINMPKMSGLSFIKTLSNPPAVIITTAYREYALESYELNVVDYLKKPFAFERFFMAVNKAIDRISSKQNIQQAPICNNNAPAESKPNFLFVKEDKVTYKVDLNEILYIESVGDYNKIITTEKVYVTYQTLKKLVGYLPEHEFARIHKSFIISIAKIDRIIGNQVKIKDQAIPIGQTYRKGFFELIEGYQ